MSVKRNTLYNILGSLAPMLIGMVTVPIYLKMIGDARYGVLALVWLFLGYFGLFDPGIARAAEYHIARLHGPEFDRERESVFWTAILINFALSMVGGVVLYFAAHPVFISAFKMPESMRQEVLSSLPWLAASVPVSVMTGMLGGALQARERFGEYNTISLFGAVVSQLAPLAVAFWHGPDLRWLIPAILISRTVSAIPLCVVLWKALPIGVGGHFEKKKARQLFVYGGWITLTNVLNPILTTIDRMLIGSVISATAVTFYSVPFNLVTRASIIPGALSQSLFPKLSRGALAESANLASEAVRGLAAVMTPLVVAGIALLPAFMHVWVGASFAAQAAPVGVILLIGVWINSLAYIPYSHLQAIDRPDVVAKFHAIELIPFLGVLWVGLHSFGLVGAAWAWTLRATADAILLFAVSGKIPHWQRLLPGAGLVLLAWFCSPPSLLTARMGFSVLIFVASLVWAWQVSPQARNMVQFYFHKRVPAAS